MRRTTFLSTALLLGSLAVVFGCGGESEPYVVIASFGGAWQEAQRKAMFEPFAEASGVAVLETEYDGDYALIRENGASGLWDVVDVEPAELLRGAEEGLYEPIDYSGIELEAVPESARHPYGVALMRYAVVLGYDAARFPAPEAAPETWADFWDLQRFPGKRALRGSPEWMLEIALMADGVSPSRLYPLDLDRALRSLEKIEDAVVVFGDWSEPGQLLASGQVALAAGTNGRISAAREAGGEVGISWHGALVSSDYFVIPEGSTRKQHAQELIRYAVGRQAQSAFPHLIDYGPVNLQAVAALPEELLARLPSHPSNVADSVRFNAEWWFAHEDEAHRRYGAWLEGLGR